ncbi:MAG TPA: NrfD/PsrC family molybdoenzyme membrane anchor subunit [Acidimicrobiales bacterium]|nr:NrfD/PsrC family molybdoenzyme membrane anchor subunit [Acidimicrobiales bacterium]
MTTTVEAERAVQRDDAQLPEEVLTSRTSVILRPLGRPSLRYLAVLAAALAGLAWFAQAWAFQLRNGLVVTGLSDWGTGGGVPWGIYVGSFIWWVGIAHGGIVVSAAVRVFKIDALKPVARLAELLTLAALVNAGLYIIVHLGRPDRIVTSILPHLGQTIRSSPLAWDVVVLTLYFVLTGTYLALTVRHDLHELRDRLPRALRPFYRVVLVGYRPGERRKAERMAWWLALGVIVLAPLFLHGGVIPWLFAVLPSQPGWFGSVQGPLFLAAALTSALAAVTILAFVFRRAYGWEGIIDDGVFRSLSRWTGLFALLYLWLQLQQVVTGSAMAPDSVDSAVDARLEAPLFWLAVALLAITVGHAGLQTLSARLFSVGRTAAVAGLPVLAILIEKTLFVVEGPRHPAFSLYAQMPSSYAPSWVELSSVVGAFAIVVLLFLVAVKALPLVETEEDEP